MSNKLTDKLKKHAGKLTDGWMDEWMDGWMDDGKHTLRIIKESSASQ